MSGSKRGLPNAPHSATFGDREASPIEILAGLRVWGAEGLSLSLAGGSGTGRGYGSPDFRAVVSFGWAVPDPAPEPEPVPATAPWR